jgi:2-dehydro-3-deoxyphosphogluconate aldolase/(4S)-4-hydroxy-2-oxoglutarate aldolase
MDYLSLPNVLCVGGSWIAKPKDIREKRWSEIEVLAKEAAALV